MTSLHLPFVKLPEEFVTLLKRNMSAVASPEQVFDLLRPNKALYQLLETSFKELDDGRGLPKTMMALGWHNFRNRMASLYIYKTIYGSYPSRSDLTLVEDLILFESKFREQDVHSHSRTFLLGFYLKLAQLQIQKKENNKFLDLNFPTDQVLAMLKVSQGRSAKSDWLILMTAHLLTALGEKTMAHALISGKSFNEIYQRMDISSRRLLHQNLLAYSASVQEPDNFLYEKV